MITDLETGQGRNGGLAATDQQGDGNLLVNHGFVH